jgi:hypothetical protein
VQVWKNLAGIRDERLAGVEARRVAGKAGAALVLYHATQRVKAEPFGALRGSMTARRAALHEPVGLEM